MELMSGVYRAKFDMITVNQIDDMKHAIGFDKSKTTGIKHRKMYAYRNYYMSYKKMEGWENLVNLRLATRSGEEQKIYYSLTTKGLSFLAKLCGFETIVEIN